MNKKLLKYFWLDSHQLKKLYNQKHIKVYDNLNLSKPYQIVTLICSHIKSYTLHITRFLTPESI